MRKKVKRKKKHHLNSLKIRKAGSSWFKLVYFDILAHLTCHVVTLHAVYSRILVGVFLLYLLVIALKKAKNLLVRRV